MIKNIAVIGSSGAIGHAFTQQLAKLNPEATIHAFSQHVPSFSSDNIQVHAIDYSDEASIEASASLASAALPLDWVIIATGLLHEGGLLPEKTLQSLSAEKLHRLFEVNTILPALIIKHFHRQLNRENRSILAAMSARVGSISDNQLGGWYAYRASKAALNMIIKCAAIEVARSNKQAIVVGLHPGTVDSKLSKPFQANVPEKKLFTPEFSVGRMLQVMDNLTLDQTGRCIAWDGNDIEP